MDFCLPCLANSVLFFSTTAATSCTNTRIETRFGATLFYLSPTLYPLFSSDSVILPPPATAAAAHPTLAQVDFCANDPCPDGHRCIDHGDDFSCECPGGRNGPDCNQVPRTVSTPSPSASSDTHIETKRRRCCCWNGMAETFHSLASRIGYAENFSNHFHSLYNEITIDQEETFMAVPMVG